MMIRHSISYDETIERVMDCAFPRHGPDRDVLGDGRKTKDNHLPLATPSMYV
jgi:hypothetical protein